MIGSSAARPEGRTFGAFLPNVRPKCPASYLRRRDRHRFAANLKRHSAIASTYIGMREQFFCFTEMFRRLIGDAMFAIVIQWLFFARTGFYACTILAANGPALSISSLLF